MIGFIQGTVRTVGPRSCVVLTGGDVGYEIFTTEPVLAALSVGATVAFHVVTVVRDDAIVLYGFSSADEKNLFLLLTTVNKVGPRIALSIIGSATVVQIISAVVSRNTSFFSNISGIGKKTAERIIIEMYDKVKDFAAAAEERTIPPLESRDSKWREAEMGLIALGYHPHTVRSVLARIEGKELKRPEEIVREALSLLREQVRR